MRIAFIGNFDFSFCTESHHKLTFEKLGHTVIPFQENRTSVDEIMKEAVNCDMLYWTHTHSFKLDTWDNIERMLHQLKILRIPTVGFHLDLWLGLQREKDLHTDPYWQIEHFFTVDPQMAVWLNNNSFYTKGYYLPAGCLEEESYLGTPDKEKYPHDIVFTGSMGYHFEYPYRPRLIKWLHDTYGERFAHYGGGGKQGLRGSELNNMYASAKIVIGDTLCKDFKYEGYFSDRAFEVPARGGFMIFPYIKGIEEMYELGKEIVPYEYENFGQLKFLIDYFLENDEDRERIRIAGHERAKKDHTYTNRIKSLIETLGL